MSARLIHFIEFSLIFLIIIIDQYSKIWAQQRDAVILNKGGVFGLLPSGWWVLLLGLVLVFVAYEWWHAKGLERLGMGLLFAGGLSNIIDRLIFGSVRDFIYYPWFGFYGNIADIVLGIGVGIVILSKMLQYHDVSTGNTF